MRNCTVLRGRITCTHPNPDAGWFVLVKGGLLNTSNTCQELCTRLVPRALLCLVWYRLVFARILQWYSTSKVLAIWLTRCQASNPENMIKYFMFIHHQPLFNQNKLSATKRCACFMGYTVIEYYRCKSLKSWSSLSMMTSSDGNIFRVTEPLCGEFTDHRWTPLTKASDAGLWCFLWSGPEQTAE